MCENYFSQKKARPGFRGGLRHSERLRDGAVREPLNVSCRQCEQHTDHNPAADHNDYPKQQNGQLAAGRWLVEWT
jgi:hypothetical protein